jgi:hypothetical protein
LHDGFRFLRCFSLQTKFFKPFHRLPLNLGSKFVVWLPLCEISHRSDQCHYRGLAQGFAGLKTVQPVEKNVRPILIATDQDWSLLTHLEDALSDAIHHYGIKAPSPFNRNINLVDWDVFWLAHDCRIKAGNFDERKRQPINPRDHERGLAEFERERIRARTGEGGKRAEARGVRFGPPPRLNGHQRQEALQRLAAGETQADMARTSRRVSAGSEQSANLFDPCSNGLAKAHTLSGPEPLLVGKGVADGRRVVDARVDCLIVEARSRLGSTSVLLRPHLCPPQLIQCFRPQTEWFQVGCRLTFLHIEHISSRKNLSASRVSFGEHRSPGSRRASCQGHDDKPNYCRQSDECPRIVDSLGKGNLVDKRSQHRLLFGIE